MLFSGFTFLPQKTFRKIAIFLRRDRVQKISRWKNFEKKIAAIDCWRPTLQCCCFSEIRSSSAKNRKSGITESHFLANIAPSIFSWYSFWSNHWNTMYNWSKTKKISQIHAKTYVFTVLKCSEWVWVVSKGVCTVLNHIWKNAPDTKSMGKSTAIIYFLWSEF